MTKKIIIMIIIFASILSLASSVSIAASSALRMCDSPICDISLSLTAGKFNLTIPLAHLTAHPYMVFCLRDRPIVNGSDSYCQVTGLNGGYNCFDIAFTKSKVVIQQFTSTSQLVQTNVTKVPSAIPNFQDVSDFSFVLNSLLKPNSIYELNVGYMVDLSNDPMMKQVYFHTYKSANQTASDNLLMQRNIECFQFYYLNDYNYNLVFYGGVLRNNQDVLFMHVLSVLTNTKNVLNMWGGISFSMSHAGRDMIGFSSKSGINYDLFSLYQSAPFQDTSLNVLGSHDILDIASSQPYTSDTFYYFTGMSRLYDTLDTNGDEIIRKKMANQYCYVLAYSQGTTAIVPTDKSMSHDYSACWLPNITVWENNLQIFIGFMIVLVLCAL